MSQRRKSLSFRKGCSLDIKGHCNGICALLLPLPRICWHPSRAAHYKLALPCIQMCLISELSWFSHFHVKHINILFTAKMLSYQPNSVSQLFLSCMLFRTNHSCCRLLMIFLKVHQNMVKTLIKL